MARTEDSPWAVSVAQVASRPGQSKEIDATFPAPSGIGDEIVGVDEGADVAVVGSFDSIVDGLILNARISAPVHAECTRCLKPIQRDWTVNVTSFFPYEDKSAAGKGGKAGKNGKEEEVDIMPARTRRKTRTRCSTAAHGPTSRRCCATRWSRNCRCSRCASRIARACARSAASTSTRTPTISMT